MLYWSEVKNMFPTFTSEAEGPLMAPKKEENTFETLWNSHWMLKDTSKVAKGGILWVKAKD